MVCGPLDLASAVVCGGSGHPGPRLGGFQAVPTSAGVAAGPSLRRPVLRGHSARCGCLRLHERLYVVLRWRGRACVRHGPVRRWSAACQPSHAPRPTGSDFGCGTPRDLFPRLAGLQRNREPELAGVADRDRLHPLYEPPGRDGSAEFFHHRGAEGSAGRRAARAPQGRGGQRCEIGLSRRDQSRDPHADERRYLRCQSAPSDAAGQ